MIRQDPIAAFDRAAARLGTRPFERAELRRSLWQLANSFLPFLALCALMYRSLDWGLGWSYGITLALGILAAGFVVRIFIIQHDCGHGAFFRSRRANDSVGLLCSIITMTPYAMWRRQHAGHHSHWNNLDRRLAGADIYSSCTTVAEYQRMTGWQQWRYRLVQHPVVAWIILPPLVFLLLYRVPFDAPRAWWPERRAVCLTNLALLGVWLGLGYLFGFRAVLLVQTPIIVVAALVGVWLFSVQHRFERSLWARQKDWDAVSASVDGSSYLKLPRVLQWFSGNIGFHHVHHLNPHVPNYRLQACHDANPPLWRVCTMTLWDGIASWRCALWDEQSNRMVPFPIRMPNTCRHGRSAQTQG
jgi:omega-6 fatty acid desaturase (delta-12 desaturase)